MTISAASRYLVRETAIGSGMNIVMSLAATFVASGGTFAPPTLADVLLQSFMLTLMSVLIATLLTRMRRRKALLAFDGRAGWGSRQLVPHNALLRALLAGAVCLSIVAPVVRTMLPSLLALAPGPLEVGISTAVYALLLSLLVTPVALILATNEEPVA